MKCSIVTCYYDIRKSRNIDYYLPPLNDFIHDLSGSDIDIHVFTDVDQIINKTHATNVFIHNLTFQELIGDIWKDSNWSAVYEKFLINRDEKRFEEKIFPNLLAVWLGKFKMIEVAAENSDFVLWQDCGIRMYLFKKKAQNYKKKTLKASDYQSAIENLAKSSPVVLLESEKKIDKEFHGVNMKKYSKERKDKLIGGGFMLFSKQKAKSVKGEIEKNWSKLIENSDYGTEENPLTIYYWENDCRVMTLKDWIKALKLESNEIKLI